MRLKDCCYSNSKIKEIIGEFIHSKRDRLILEMAFIDGFTHEEISEHIGLSSRQVSNIISKNSIVLTDHLKGEKNHDVTGFYGNIQELRC